MRRQNVAFGHMCSVVGALCCLNGAFLVGCSQAPAFVEEPIVDAALGQSGAEADSTAMASRCATFGSNLPECVDVEKSSGVVKGSEVVVVVNSPVVNGGSTETGTTGTGSGGTAGTGSGGTAGTGSGGTGGTGSGGGSTDPQTHVVAFSVPAGRTDSIPGAVTIRPLGLYFVLDITGSMQGNINAIKNNIVSFVDELKSRNFLPKLGMIPFRDTYGREVGVDDVKEGRFNLSDDVAAFKTYVSGLTATGGGDANEASLAATESALSEVMAREKRADALKVVLTITDNPGHREGAVVDGRRDCSIESTVNAFNALDTEAQKDVKFFYSTSNGSPCSGYRSATSQFTTILDNILPIQSKEIRGGQIPWPLTTTALLDNFTTLLTKVGAPANLVCLQKKASLKVDGAEIASWSSFDYASSYSSFKSGNSQELQMVLQQSQVDAVQSKGGTLEATRCCFDVSSADAGDFSSCVQEKAETTTVKSFLVK